MSEPASSPGPAASPSRGAQAVATAPLGPLAPLGPRVGFGFDVHAFGPGDQVWLAGVCVPHTQGVVAHSDGDVLLHALCDALLGAVALGDIGQHFPDTDPQWRGAASHRFVTHCLGLVKARGYVVGNADLTLLAEAPRLKGHRDAMIARVAELLELPTDAVGLKATTTEQMGFTGRREGLAAQAAVMLWPAPVAPTVSPEL